MSTVETSAPSGHIGRESDGMPAARRYRVMLCVLLGVTLMSLDSAIANIALPTIAHDLAASDSATVWVVNIYQLGAVLCLLPAAALGEIFGLKRVYAVGLIVFTAASVGCAMSPSLPVLVGSRLAQGIGGACIAAIGPAVIREIYPRHLIGRGLALIALSVAASGALGPTVAALILSVATWPWLFLVNLPIGLIAAPVFLLAAPAGKRHPRPFDASGAALSAVALGLLLVGVDTLGGGEHRLAIGEIALGLTSIGLLFWQQSRRDRPMLPLDLLKIPLFSLSVVTSICSYSAQILAYVSLPFLFETVMHRSQIATGLLVTPWPLLVVVAAPIAGRLVARYPAAILGSIGLAVLAAGLALMAALPAAPADWDIAWRMALCGIGFGFFQTPNNATIMTAGPVMRSGAAGGMLAVARTLGWCLGSALVTVIFATTSTDATIRCLEVACGFAGVGAIASVARFSAHR
jgi:DHA2 family multidrug resistance protein-like MFS transporter